MNSIFNKVRAIRNSFIGSSSSKSEEGAANAPIDAKGLALASLRQLGCRPNMGENGDMVLSFKGEQFILRHIGGLNLRVWFEAGTLKANSKVVAEALNKSNFAFGPTAIAEKVEGIWDYNILLRQDIMLHPALPDIHEYLLAVFDNFIQMKGIVAANLKEAAEKQATIRRPIGFTAPVRQTA